MNFIKNGDFRHFFASYFITRAEFDSLKNNFQSQIDQYNSSIDSKIDGAIAAYLAGIKLTKSSTYDLIWKDNDNLDVTFVNDINWNEFKQPDVFFSCFLETEIQSYPIGYYNWTSGLAQYRQEGGSWRGVTSYTDHTKQTTFSTYTVYKTYKNWGSNETNARMLAKIIDGDESNVKKIAWNGVANRYKEEWSIAISKLGTWNQNPAYFDNIGPNVVLYAKVVEPLNLDANGYNANLTKQNIASNLKIKNTYSTDYGATTGVEYEDSVT